MEEATLVKELFELDRDEGFTIQLVVWPDIDGHTDWDAEFVIHREDFETKESTEDAVNRLKRFLNGYKKKPLPVDSGKIMKRRTDIFHAVKEVAGK